MTTPLEAAGGRGFVAHEATLPQLQALRPNVAVLPWGATEGHGRHLPHGTDVEEAAGLGEAAVARANAAGARCVLLPAVPFGNDNQQLVGQVATITMRTRTQLAVLTDVAESLVRQGIRRLVVLNFHGGNEFKPLVRDVMMEVPIFVVVANGYQLDPGVREELTPGVRSDHADEFETSLMLHLRPGWVAGRETWGDGAVTPSALPAVTGTPGVWAPRDWAALSADTGSGDPRGATAEKGARIFERLVRALVPVLVELSGAKEGEFPLVIR